MHLLESFSPCELPCEFQAGQHAGPNFTWHLETPSENQAKPPHGTQAGMKDEKRPSFVTVQHHEPPLISHSLWQAAFPERAWCWLSEGGWCSSNRAVGSAPGTESPSVLTELGIPAGDTMETDINQPDAN